jgi:hypothetical protein
MLVAMATPFSVTDPVYYFSAIDTDTILHKMYGSSLNIQQLLPKTIFTTASVLYGSKNLE